MALSISTVLPAFYPATHFGGPVVQAYEVGRRLVARGHKVSVVTTDWGIGSHVPRNQWTLLEGMRVWYGSTRPWNRVAPYWEPQLKGPLKEAIADSDLLTLRVGLTLLSSLAVRLANTLNKPYVYNAEGNMCPKRLVSRGLSKWMFLRFFERKIIREAAGLQAVTCQEKSDLIAQGANAERIVVIPNGVELQTTLRDVNGRFRRAWHIPSSAILILFLGRISQLKGIDLLLSAFAEHYSEHNAYLVIAGPHDGEQSRLLRLVSNRGLEARVTFPGVIAAEDRWDLLRESDIFALTSYTEGLPNAVLEALAIGLPCLITDRCNLPEVDEYDSGVVTTPSILSVSSGLKSLLCDSSRRKSMSKNARRLVTEKFELELIVSKLEKFYEQVLMSN